MNDDMPWHQKLHHFFAGDVESATIVPHPESNHLYESYEYHYIAPDEYQFGATGHVLTTYHVEPGQEILCGGES